MTVQEFRDYTGAQNAPFKGGKYAFLTDTGNYYLSNSQKAISTFSKSNKIICFMEWTTPLKDLFLNKAKYQEFPLECCKHFIK